VIDGYHSEVYVAEDRLLAWRRLSKGVHRLLFHCVGKNPSSAGYGFGLDTLIVARVGQLRSGDNSRAATIRIAAEHGMATRVELQSALSNSDQSLREAAAWAFTQYPEHAAQAVMALKTALSDAAPFVRGLAAVALRNCGSCSEAALKELTARLKDADPNVRIAAADALSKLGPKAAPALAGLIELGGAADQHPHVLRSVSAALGAIGPAAAEAIPVLEQMRRHFRVRWAAEAAIATIQQRPAPQGPEPGGVKLQ
jgi:HEAT repeat protein